MDSNRGGKSSRGGGIIKGKLRSLYRSSSNKVEPSPGPRPSQGADEGGYMTMLNQQNHNMITTTQNYNKVPTPTSTASSVGMLIVNRDRVTPQLSKHITSVAGYLPTPDITTTTGVDSYRAARRDSLYGGAVDEAVDLKAANYISSVRERFRLEYSN